MSLSFILITSFLIYAAIIYWLSTLVKFKEIWRGVDVVDTYSNTPLARIAKYLLDAFLIFLLVIAVFWPVFFVVMAISQQGNPNWGIDIGIFSGLKIDVGALTNVEFTGLRNPEITGKTVLQVDTSNFPAWCLFAIQSQISVMVAIYVIVLLRSLLMSLRGGNSFSIENSLRIRKIGFVLILWNLIYPMIQYYGWGMVVNTISFSSEGIRLYPAFEVNGVAIFSGLMLLVLSGVLREAADMKKEQQLTV